MIEPTEETGIGFLHRCGLGIPYLPLATRAAPRPLLASSKLAAMSRPRVSIARPETRPRHDSPPSEPASAPPPRATFLAPFGFPDASGNKGTRRSSVSSSSVHTVAVAPRGPPAASVTAVAARSHTATRVAHEPWRARRAVSGTQRHAVSSAWRHPQECVTAKTPSPPRSPRRRAFFRAVDSHFGTGTRRRRTTRRSPRPRRDVVDYRARARGGALSRPSGKTGQVRAHDAVQPATAADSASASPRRSVTKHNAPVAAAATAKRAIARFVRSLSRDSDRARHMQNGPSRLSDPRVRERVLERAFREQRAPEKRDDDAFDVSAAAALAARGERHQLAPAVVAARLARGIFCNRQIRARPAEYDVIRVTAPASRNVAARALARRRVGGDVVVRQAETRQRRRARRRSGVVDANHGTVRARDQAVGAANHDITHARHVVVARTRRRGRRGDVVVPRARRAIVRLEPPDVFRPREVLRGPCVAAEQDLAPVHSAELRAERARRHAADVHHVRAFGERKRRGDASALRRRRRRSCGIVVFAPCKNAFIGSRDGCGRVRRVPERFPRGGRDWKNAAIVRCAMSVSSRRPVRSRARPSERRGVHLVP